MTIRWSAVLIGFLVDFLLSTLIQLFARPDFYPTPSLSNRGDLVILLLSALSIGVGGYVAGRLGREHRAAHGALVGAVDILFSTLLGAAMSRPIVLMEGLGLLLAGLGGVLSNIGRSDDVTK